MKQRVWGGFFGAVLFLLAGASGYGLDTASYAYIDKLQKLPGPGRPEVFEDAVIFTAPASYRRVGAAFAHEDFAKIHWFTKLYKPLENPAVREPKAKKDVELYRDAGILFLTFMIPEGLDELEYRLVLDGLWSADPLNPVERMDAESGLDISVVKLPKNTVFLTGALASKEGVNFRFRAEPGHVVTLAGDFNAWDPFMYRMNDSGGGQYSLTLPLPSGVWHYVFYYKGERQINPDAAAVYYQNGKVASEIVVK